MQLTGIHHLTAITADAAGNNRFYTDTLGLRRVKKTVNQDDTSAYHLFFADGAATGGRIRVLLRSAAWQIDVAWLTGEVRLARAGVPP